MSEQLQTGQENAAAAPIDMIEAGIGWASGRAGRIDLVEAHKWFNLAALRGEGRAVTHRAEVASEMTRAEIAQAQRAAREWLARH